MKIDLHIHTKTGSDGNLPVEEVFQEAKNRSVDLISITDHDSIDCQGKAITLAQKHGMSYVTGVELNVTFYYPEGKKDISLDFLGYKYDISNQELKGKLQLIKEYRRKRARQILRKLNIEFDKEGMERFTEEDLKKIEDSVDGTFGRPHIANYLVEKGIVKDKREAFDKY
ncbi:MAG TPA: PHP domain-containing protein, partial [Dehalococcoidia bacterium]|nr:PHP domain-containing protein [Dehalococcoidia bacterium]